MNVLLPSLQVVSLGVLHRRAMLMPVRAVLVGGVSVTVPGRSWCYKQYLFCYGGLHCTRQSLFLHRNLENMHLLLEIF